MILGTWRGVWIELIQQWEPSLYLHWYQPPQASAEAKRARKLAAMEMMRTLLNFARGNRVFVVKVKCWMFVEWVVSVDDGKKGDKLCLLCLKIWLIIRNITAMAVSREMTSCCHDWRYCYRLPWSGLLSVSAVMRGTTSFYWHMRHWLSAPLTTVYKPCKGTVAVTVSLHVELCSLLL